MLVKTVHRCTKIINIWPNRSKSLENVINRKNMENAPTSVFFRGRLSVNCGKNGQNCGRANILKCNRLFGQFLPQNFFASGAKFLPAAFQGLSVTAWPLKCKLWKNCVKKKNTLR